MAKIDSIYDFSDKALVEVKSWLEPWFLTRDRDAGRAVAADYGQATYDAAGTVIANNATSPLAWVSTGGTALLNLSNPTNPAVLTAGIYSAAVEFTVLSAMTANGYYQGSVIMDASGSSGGGGTAFGFQTGAAVGPRFTVTVDWYIAAGGTIVAQVQNKDGAASRTFQMFTSLQRVA